MLYLLWAVINIALFLFFIFICFRATKLIREKLGLLASIVFVFGLLSFVGHSNFRNDNVEPNSNGLLKQWKFTSTDSILNGAFEYKTCVLDRTMISKYILGISYGRHPDTKKITPVFAHSLTNGLTSGTTWTPLSISIKEDESGTKFEYSVDGTVSWTLLGVTVFSESKSFNGFVEIQ